MDKIIKWIGAGLILVIVGYGSYVFIRATIGPEPPGDTQQEEMVDTTANQAYEQDSLRHTMEAQADTRGERMEEDQRDEGESMEEDEHMEEGEEQKDKHTSQPPPVGEQIAPGRARVRFEINEIQSMEDATYLKLHILEVLGYGSSTPVLATSSKLLVNGTAFLSNEENSTADLDKNIELTGLLEHHQQPDLEGTEKKPSWKLITITY